MLFDLYDAKANLPDLVEKDNKGAEIVIAKSGEVKAKPAAVNEASQSRARGLWRGKILVSDDFDDPLPDKILCALRGE